MAIARNKKNPPVDLAAIEAFGAAAEARPQTPAESVVAAPVKRRVGSPARAAGAVTASNEEKAPPQSSLVRWAGEEETRDRLLAYARDERYKMQDLMVKAMQLGMDRLEGK